MYRSFISPQLDYADVIWDNCSLKLAEDLESLHLDAIRTIIGAIRGTSHQILYTESGFTTLRERRFRYKIIMYHKNVQENTPIYLKEEIPHLFPQLIHTIDDDHSNDRYQNIKFRLTGNHLPHRQLQCGIIYQKTYSEQNQLVKLNTSEKTQIPRLSFTTVVEKHR